jgi:hypothetical protein
MTKKKNGCSFNPHFLDELSEKVMEKRKTLIQSLEEIDIDLTFD